MVRVLGVVVRRFFATAIAASMLAGLPARADDNALPWFDGPRPGSQAWVALKLLADARSHGLDPRDYHTEVLQRALTDAQRGPLPTDAAVQGLQRALDAALQRFLRDLREGRVVPARIGHDYKPRGAQAAFDAAGALRAALALGDVTLAQRQAVPRVPQYERLREALQRYRALEGTAAWRQRLPDLPRSRQVGAARRLDPGQPWEGVEPLAERLSALDDLPAAAAADASARGSYEGPLVEAVRSFQRRHGLEPDGVIGRGTIAALDITPAQRVRQIELSLERLRWTPLQAGPRMIVVNIPEFVLRGYEVDGERFALRVESRVIVGKALDTRTPLIQEDLRHIEFQPYWNVPPSIARNELVPRLRRDAGYWTREGFEFVPAGGGAADDTLTQAKLDAVLAGALRIRQRPGPRNALGDIKFVFPNRESIYLHHTPSVGLFSRARRDFSHGCVRVEQPVALAAFALEGVAGWDEPRIRRAMTEAPPGSVRLARPVPVLIAYGTALARATGVHFYEDVYGHDRALDAALRRPRPPAFPSHLLTP